MRERASDVTSRDDAPSHSLQWCLLCSSACTNRPHWFHPIPLERAGLLTAVCARVWSFTPYFQLTVVVSEAEFPSAFLESSCPVTHYSINVSTQLFLTHSLCHFLFVTPSLSVSLHLCLLFCSLMQPDKASVSCTHFYRSLNSPHRWLTQKSAKRYLAQVTGAQVSVLKVLMYHVTENGAKRQSCSTSTN